MSSAVVAVGGLALLAGFLAGFFTFKRSHRWCPDCGAVLRCVECRHRAGMLGSVGEGQGGAARQ